METPIIGLNVHLKTEARDRSFQLTRPEFCWIENAYVKLLRDAGAECVLLPPGWHSIPPDWISGLVIIGGDDYDPELQGFDRTEWNDRIVPSQQEHSDRALLAEAISRKIPVLAIGAGMQLLNVLHGGTLSYHLPEDHPEAHCHRDHDGSVIRHALKSEPGHADSIAVEVFSDRRCQVTSRHHQCVDLVGYGLVATSRSLDGIVESIESEDISWTALGVQFHPELEEADRIERLFVEHWLCRVRGKSMNARPRLKGKACRQVA